MTAEEKKGLARRVAWVSLFCGWAESSQGPLRLRSGQAFDCVARRFFHARALKKRRAASLRMTGRGAAGRGAKSRSLTPRKDAGIRGDRARRSVSLRVGLQQAAVLTAMRLHRQGSLRFDAANPFLDHWPSDPHLLQR